MKFTLIRSSCNDKVCAWCYVVTYYLIPFQGKDTKEKDEDDELLQLLGRGPVKVEDEDVASQKSVIEQKKEENKVEQKDKTVNKEQDIKNLAEQTDKPLANEKDVSQSLTSKVREDAQAPEVSKKAEVEEKKAKHNEKIDKKNEVLQPLRKSKTEPKTEDKPKAKLLDDKQVTKVNRTKMEEEDEVLGLLGRPQTKVSPPVDEEPKTEGMKPGLESKSASADGLGGMLEADKDGNKASDAASQTSQSSDSEGYLSALSEEDAESSSASVLAMLSKKGENGDDDATKFTIAPDVLPSEESKKGDEDEDILAFLGRGEGAANAQGNNKNRYTMKGKRQSSDALSETSASDEGLAEVGSSTCGDVAQNGDNVGVLEEKEEDIMALLAGGVQPADITSKSSDIDSTDNAGIKPPADIKAVIDAELHNKNADAKVKSKTQNCSGLFQTKSQESEEAEEEVPKVHIKTEDIKETQKDVSRLKKEMKKQKAIDEDANVPQLLGRTSSKTENDEMIYDVADVNADDSKSKGNLKHKVSPLKCLEDMDDEETLSLFGRSIIKRREASLKKDSLKRTKKARDDKLLRIQSKKAAEEEDIMALLSGGVEQKSQVEDEEVEVKDTKKVEEKDIKEVEEKDIKKVEGAAGDRSGSKKDNKEVKVEQKNETTKESKEVSKVKAETRQKPTSEDDESDVLSLLGRKESKVKDEARQKLTSKDDESDVLSLLGRKGSKATDEARQKPTSKDDENDVLSLLGRKGSKGETSKITGSRAKKDDEEDVLALLSKGVDASVEVTKKSQDLDVAKVDVKVEDEEPVRVLLKSPRLNRKSEKGKDAKPGNKEKDDEVVFLKSPGLKQKTEKKMDAETKSKEKDDVVFLKSPRLNRKSVKERMLNQKARKRMMTLLF